MSYFIQDKRKQDFQKEQDILQILNNLPDGLFTMDIDGRITYFNAASEQITGMYVVFATHVDREKALIGRKRTSILKSLWKS